MRRFVPDLAGSPGMSEMEEMTVELLPTKCSVGGVVVKAELSSGHSSEESSVSRDTVEASFQSSEEE